MWAGVVGTVLGLWLMAAPWALDYGPPASIVAHVIGPLAASAAWISVWGVTRPVRWLLLPLGALLVLAPIVVAHPLHAIVDNVVVGLVLAGLAFVRGSKREQLGGGWRAIVSPSADTSDASG